MTEYDRATLALAFQETYNSLVFDTCDTENFRRVANISFDSALFAPPAAPSRGTQLDPIVQAAPNRGTANFDPFSRHRHLQGGRGISFGVDVESQACTPCLFDNAPAPRPIEIVDEVDICLDFAGSRAGEFPTTAFDKANATFSTPPP